MRLNVFLGATALLAASALAATNEDVRAPSSHATRPTSASTASATAKDSRVTTDGSLDARGRRRLELVRARHEKGRRQLARLTSADKTPVKLHILRSAISTLRRAWRAASVDKAAPFVALRSAVASDLVRALDDEATIYLGRGSIPQARKRIEEALAVAPEDPRSTALADEARMAASAGTCVRLTAARSGFLRAPSGRVGGRNRVAPASARR